MKKSAIYRQPMQESLFEEEFSLEALSAMGNPLEQVSALVDFDNLYCCISSFLEGMMI